MSVLQVFEVPNSTGNPWLWGILVVPMLLVLGITILLWPRPLRIEVLDDGLRVRGSVYGRTISHSALLLEQAKIVDLDVDAEFAPSWRTNGVGLPNYQVGWFRLQNRERALCFLTRRNSVAYIPTTENYVLLTTVESPAEFLNSLRQMVR